MVKQTVKKLGLVGQSFNKTVAQEMANGLTQLYLIMRQSPAENNRLLLDKMDEYVHLSRSPQKIKTRAFDELETTLKFDIYHTIEGDYYEEIRGSLVLPTEALETYKSLSDEKRAQFRQSVASVPHKRKTLSPVFKQKTKV